VRLGLGVKWRWARQLAYLDEGATARCGERCRYNLLIGVELSTYKVTIHPSYRRGALDEVVSRARLD
jgi:hypothetical protein